MSKRSQSKGNSKSSSKTAQRSRSKTRDENEVKFPVMYRLTEQMRRLELKDLSDKKLNTLDPNPDIQVLFKEYDERFFDGLLSHFGVEVSWSDRMFRCAGMTYNEDKLSRQLLQWRVRNHIVETLLHEMIHAWSYTLVGVDGANDHRVHGPQFREKAEEIWNKSGMKINMHHNLDPDQEKFEKHVQKQRVRKLEEMKQLKAKKSGKDSKEKKEERF